MPPEGLDHNLASVGQVCNLPIYNQAIIRLAAGESIQPIARHLRLPLPIPEWDCVALVCRLAGLVGIPGTRYACPRPLVGLF